MLCFANSKCYPARLGCSAAWWMNVYEWQCEQSSAFMSHVKSSCRHTVQLSKFQEIVQVHLFKRFISSRDLHLHSIGSWKPWTDVVCSLVLHSNIKGRLFRKMKSAQWLYHQWTQWGQSFIPFGIRFGLEGNRNSLDSMDLLGRYDMNLGDSETFKRFVQSSKTSR